MEEKIKDAIGQIRPFLQRDGGDIEFVELTADNVVKVRLQGHCAGCPGAQMTIKGVVERILKESYPEADGFICAGDYDYDMSIYIGEETTTDGISSLSDTSFPGPVL